MRWSGPQNRSHGPELVRLLVGWIAAGAAIVGQVHAANEIQILSGMKTPTALSLAIDAAGTVYTADNKVPSAVRRITAGGCEAIMASFPQLDGARGLAVGPNGNVYVGATGSHNLLRIEPNGQVVELMTSQQFLTLSAQQSNLWLPVAIALDADGRHAYVSDQNTPVIVRIDTVTGAQSLAYPRPGTDLRPADAIIHPRGMVVDPDGNLFVAAGNEQQVIKVPADGGAAVVVLQDDPLGIRVTEPYSVRLDGERNLYVAAFGTDNVLKITPSGTVTQLMGPADGLDGPRDLAVTVDGIVYVANAEPGTPTANSIYPVFRIPNGGPPERIDDANFLKKPKSVAVDHRGNVYVTGEFSGNLVRIPTQPTGLCGNGVIDAPDETCDYNAGEKNCCCTLDCTLHPQGALCSSDNNECTDDVCSGGDLCVHAPRTGSCTDDRVFCNGAETCIDAVCTHTGDPCASGGPCNDECRDLGGGTGSCAVLDPIPCPEDDNLCTETRCDGKGHCVPFAAHAGDICRTSAGVCDIAEQCNGLSKNCPTDVLQAPTTVCRASAAGGCDEAEFCDGISPACPADAFATPGTPCSAGTCDTAGKCQTGGDGAGRCGDKHLDDGEDCDLGDDLNGAPQESCCTKECQFRSSSFVCRDNESTCQKERTCGDAQSGTCPEGFVSEPNDEICSPEIPDPFNGCKLYRCQDGACSKPICTVQVTPITPAGAKLPQAFAIVCGEADGVKVEGCNAVGYLDATAILGGGSGRTRAASCPDLAAQYQAGCATVDPLYPYCRMVQRKLGKRGILTGKCKRIFDQNPGRRQCIRWLAKLGKPECTTPAVVGFRPMFRIETTLTDIQAPIGLPEAIVVKFCDREECRGQP